MLFNTAGELRRFIEQNIPDNTPLASYHSDMERHGYIPGMHCHLDPMSKQMRETYDRFDYTSYKYEVLVKDDKGTQYLMFG